MYWKQRSFIDADGSCGICHLARSESQMSGKYPQREAAEILTEQRKKYLQSCGRNTYRAEAEIHREPQRKISLLRHLSSERPVPPPESPHWQPLG